jgi:F-type H+-transporting ATPase subunit epsilon
MTGQGRALRRNWKSSMATFHFELVSPQKVAFSGEVDQVDVPGAEGDFGVLAGHAPLISLIRPGIMTVYAGGEQTRLVVLGGFAEVGPDGLTVLADVATTVEDIDRAALQAQIGEMEGRVKEMEQGSELDKMIARLDHFKALDTHLQGTAMH